MHLIRRQLGAGFTLAAKSCPMSDLVRAVLGRSCPIQMLRVNACLMAFATRVRGFVNLAWRFAVNKDAHRSVRLGRDIALDATATVAACSERPSQAAITRMR